MTGMYVVYNIMYIIHYKIYTTLVHTLNLISSPSCTDKSYSFNITNNFCLEQCAAVSTQPGAIRVPPQITS